MQRSNFDIVVIGGGHAGAEAARAAAQLGARTALVTHDRDALGRMSCNPAVGGIGKGQLVREVDALGGLIGLVIDEAGIQFRMLNRRKGPAVWAPRAQADRDVYSRVLRRHLEGRPNLEIVEGGVAAIESRHERQGCPHVCGVTLEDGRRIVARAVVVAAGTFLRGLMHTGRTQTPGGRIHEPAAERLSASLQELGLRLGRLKTGTPPRVAHDTVDFARLSEQAGDGDPTPFSFLTDRITQPQVCCWLTSTTPELHARIRARLDDAPLYSGQIGSTGPRYCPSIETKIVRFPEKEQHQIFLEPEGRNSDQIYINGLSTSLPTDVQREIVALVPGLERARIVQWGYAIEYDYVPPEQVDATLATRAVGGLYLCGQILGTSGYEEAAGLGVVAGTNAARYVVGQDPLMIGRDEGYIGVMIDDLVTRGLIEPYRMFTSRAEHRMHLRCDNADSRLTPKGRAVGLVDDRRWARFQERDRSVAAVLEAMPQIRVDGRSVQEWLRRPDADGARFARIVADRVPAAARSDVWARALVEVKYAGYIARQRRSIEQFREMEDRVIPSDVDYAAIPHLRREAAERWQMVRPRSLGQATRVSGIHPTDVTVLLVHLAARERFRGAEGDAVGGVADVRGFANLK